MDDVWMIALTFLFSYLVGSIPFGLLIVRLISGKDIRSVESGRTGGTNAMRAAGLFAGAMTAGMDVFKGVATGWIAGSLVPEHLWVRVVAALLAIMGHNYSIFLIEKHTNGKIRLRGGAGGAPALGGAISLWPPAAIIILLVGGLVFLIVGYASLTTISVAVVSIIIFTVRAFQGLSPWFYVLYGFGALIIVTWALRPNLERLKNRTERVVGLRAYLHKRGQNGVNNQ